MDGGSWTNNISWVHGYETCWRRWRRRRRTSTRRSSAAAIATDEQRYRNALFHLLMAQTSCYRYWGQGIWTDYGKELSRRADAIINSDYA